VCSDQVADEDVWGLEGGRNRGIEEVGL